MRSVNIGELKNQLSAYLQHVRTGEEVVVQDRNRPIARIVPFVSATIPTDEEQALFQSGEMLPPAKPMDWKAFNALRGPGVSKAAAIRSLLDERRGDR